MQTTDDLTPTPIPMSADSSASEEAGTPAKPEPGGFMIRAGARLIDWVVTFCVGFVAAVVLGLGAGIYRAMTGADLSLFFKSLQETGVISWVGGMIGVVAYHTFAEGIAGATIGKRILGLQVCDISLGPCRIGQAFKRSLAFFFDALFFGLVAERYMSDSPMKQRAGDHWADTVVVKRRSVPTHRSGLRFLAGSMTAVFVQGTVAIVTHLAQFAWILWAG